MERRVVKKDRVINNKGFTLIEMAMVLVIIGLILGAAVTGKDLMNSAKQKSVYTKFIQPWTLAVVSYYDRTGQILGDGGDNGGTADTDPDGKFDDSLTFSDAIAALEDVGLTVPSSNTDESSQYSYAGAYSGNQTITLSLASVTSKKDSGTVYNVITLADVPTDLAIALDTILDGEADGTAGNFRQNDETDVDTYDWPNASTTTTVGCLIILDIP